MIGALPIIIAAIAAKQVSNLDEVSIVAGVVAGVLSVDGGIIGGIIGGILAGVFVHYFFLKCISWKFPMTTVNIVTGGIAGLLAGLLVYFYSHQSHCLSAMELKLLSNQQLHLTRF